MTLQYFTWKDVTEKDFARPDFQVWFRGVVKEANDKNKEVGAEAARQYSTMIMAAQQLYGSDSNEVRYLKKAGIPDPVNNAAKEKKVWSKWEVWKKARADAERRADQAEARRARNEDAKRQREAEREVQRIEEEARLKAQRDERYDYFKRRSAAITSLEAKGLVAGLDFDPNRAITYLKKVQGEWSERDLELEAQYRQYEG